MNEATGNALRHHFGHDSLRGGQREVIDRVLAGVNTLAVLPTGGGKSLCYQLPAVMLDGMTVVVSPLIALMRDQVDVLKRNKIDAERLDSAGTEEENDKITQKVLRGEIKILYVSPEWLSRSNLLDILNDQNVSLVAIDEAHCVSEWGHSFRPSYLRLAKRVSKIKPRSILALTATAGPSVAREIRKVFGILKRDQVQTTFFRPNLHFLIRPCADEEKDAFLLDCLSDAESFPAIVYATKRETVESVASTLRGQGIHACAYHAGMPADARSVVQDEFLTGKTPVICATIAFGMGVDMPSVRTVVHYQPPKSPEGWIQESGRAGRDGEISQCVLLASENDRALLENFVVAQKPTRKAVENILSKFFSQGKRAVISHYDLSTLNDVARATLDILVARLEILGLIVPDEGSWLWCHAVPLEPIDKILLGFKPAEQKLLKPILETRQRVNLTEVSGGSAAGQQKLMLLLAELNASGDARMKFSHSLHHYRIRKQPDNLSKLTDKMYEVILDHSGDDLRRIDTVFSIATSRKCIAASLLAHFGEKLAESCGHCSSCLGEKRPRKLPHTLVDEVTPDELETIQQVVALRKPALASPERLARFLCGIYSPGMMRYRLYRHAHWGLLNRLPFEDVLGYARAQLM